MLIEKAKGSQDNRKGHPAFEERCTVSKFIPEESIVTT
jgi:hypothetical protein